MGDAEVDRERPVETVWRSVLYVDRILKDTNPDELPAQQPTKFESAINRLVLTSSTGSRLRSKRCVSGGEHRSVEGRQLQQLANTRRSSTSR